ncbi:calcium-binding protein, partial [Aurantiacibacter sp. D1-12]|uniref:calcium-binding protein n=1 Tax=Aurantiacibacter sp. D1-12 TaxID=2993658 RepID=UPI00237CCC85
MLFFIDDNDVTLINNGTIWLESEPQAYRILVHGSGQNFSLINNGLIYMHGTGNVTLNTGTVYAPTSLTNTGTVISVSDTGQAGVIESSSPIFVENSGILAAQTLNEDTRFIGTGNAITIDAGSGRYQSSIINHADGQILAEAYNTAIAVRLRGPGVSSQNNTPLGTPLIENAGLIEANATGPNGLSIAIYLESFDGYPGLIVNTGTIRADNFAIFGSNAYGLDVSNPQEYVLNEATGQIFGAIALGFGDDVVENHGTITGPVQLGFDNDHYFGSGQVTGKFGFVDMGWGDDLFEGGGFVDRAAGGYDQDTMSGGGGNDLLLGGFGNDIIAGDAGNDGLYGEWGDDVITTQGGDYVEGGTDQDRVILGDYTFEAAHGGTGFDVLEMAQGARDFSLSAMLTGGRISGFEAIALTGNQQLAIDAASIAALSDDPDTFWVDATATDTVHLEGVWTQGADVDFEGTIYQVWMQGDVTAYVTAEATVTPNSAPSFGGFDAIAGGTSALRPGVAAGLGYTDPIYYGTGTEIDFERNPDTGRNEFTVHRDAVFFSSNPGSVMYSYDTGVFTNNGEIYAITVAGTGEASGVAMINVDEFINNGLIYVESNTDPYYADPSGFFISYAVSPSFALTNHGEIYVYSALAPAHGVIRTGYSINTGTITAISDTHQAFGMSAASGENDDTPSNPGSRQWTNTGLIYAEGTNPDGFYAEEREFGYLDNEDPLVYATKSAAAIGVRGNASFTNDGTIIARLTDHASDDQYTIGLFTSDRSGVLNTGVINNGTIEGTYAVVFERLETTRHYVTNNGLLKGHIAFTDGDDEYDGSNGQITGTVFGFGGNDTFIGGDFADSFDGGLGDDTMAGGLGNDTYFVDSLGDVVNENAGEGSDTVVASIDYSLVGLVHVENLALSGVAGLSATGNDAANTLTGNSGNNVLTGGLGDDTLDGGEGEDTAVFSGNRADYTIVETSRGKFTISGADGTDTLVNVELAQFADTTITLIFPAIEGTPGVDRLEGTSAGDVIFGFANDDVLLGRGGDDVLDGGLGADTMYGG